MRLENMEILRLRLHLNEYMESYLNKIINKL